METFNFKAARNLGSIARMNGLDRVPIKDEKLMAEIKNKSTRSMHLYMKEWCAGYDEMSREYTNYNLAAQL